MPPLRLPIRVALLAPLVIVLAAPVLAQSQREKAYRMRIPPPSVPVRAEKFDVERYLNMRAATRPDFSASGAQIAFLSTITGQGQVWRVQKPGGWPDQVTFGQEPVGNFAWSPVAEDRLVFSRDVGGNERQQLYLADLASGAVQRLTTKDDAIHNWGGWSKDGKRIAYTSNARDQAYFDLYVLDVAGGVEKLAFQKNGSLYGAGFSPDGRKYLVTEFLSNSNQNLYLVDLEQAGEPVLLTPHEGNVRYAQARWMPDGSGIWLLTDDGREFMNPAYLDVATRKLAFRETFDWDVESLQLSDDGRRLALVVNEDGYGTLRLKDLRTKSAAPSAPVTGLPQGFVLEPVFSRDGAKLAFRVSGPRDPSDVWTYELATRKLERVTESSTAGIPRETFAPSELVHYPTQDGKTVSGFLYRPLEAADRPVPVVISVHGGPEEQSQATFSATTQYFVNRGFGVFYPNVRGSTGYGKTFSHLDDVEKRLDSVRDLADGAKWLVDNGYALPGRIAVTGSSYGGYMTLAALAFHPDLWACGVDIVGISNLKTFIANTGAWRRAIRAAEYGDPDRNGPAMDAASPIHKVADIKAPLMVIQGANDPRVPKSEAEQMVEAIRKHGGTVDYLLFPDEGHGLQKLPNRIKGYSQMADFLDRYLLAPPAASRGM